MFQSGSSAVPPPLPAAAARHMLLKVYHLSILSSVVISAFPSHLLTQHI